MGEQGNRRIKQCQDSLEWNRRTKQQNKAMSRQPGLKWENNVKLHSDSSALWRSKIPLYSWMPLKDYNPVSSFCMPPAEQYPLESCRSHNMLIKIHWPVETTHPPISCRPNYSPLPELVRTAQSDRLSGKDSSIQQAALMINKQGHVISKSKILLRLKSTVVCLPKVWFFESLLHSCVSSQLLQRC